MKYCERCDTEYERDDECMCRRYRYRCENGQKARVPLVWKLDWWDGMGMDMRYAVISLLVEKVICLPGHPGSHEWRGWRFNPDAIAVQWRV